MTDREIFVAVVEHGSFTAAAAALGVSTSYVSRCVRRLEEELGAALLSRSTRSVQQTEAGQVYYSRVAPLLAGLAEADVEVGARVVEPRGTLRIAAPLAFGRRWVLPTLLAFQRRWPEVRVDLRLSDRDTDPHAVDVTLRAGRLEDSALVARRLAVFRDVLAAPPALLDARGMPERPEDLHGWPAALYTGHRGPNQWTLSKGDRSVTPAVEPAFWADSGEAVVAAAAAGLGLVLQPEFLVAEAVQKGELVPLFEDWERRGGALWALTSSRLLPATVRTFVDDLAAALDSRPWRAG